MTRPSSSVLLSGVVGSTAYGLAGPDSDVDPDGEVRRCSRCGLADRYPSGKCRPCTKKRNAENAAYFVARSRRRRDAQIQAVREEPDRVGVIYGLIDPRTAALRYVGQTQQTLRRRLSGHLRSPRGKHAHLPVSRWIAKLQRNGLEPMIEVLDGPMQVADLDAAEQRHIAVQRVAGAKLLNLCPGGGASFGTWNMPAEAIQRIADSKRGRPRSPETRAKLSAANLGKRPTAETLAKRSAALRGRKQSDEWIKKRVQAIRETKLSKPTCSRGHEWSETNTRWYDGNRYCRTCAREYSRKRRAAAPPRPRKPRAPRPRARDGLFAQIGPGVEITRQLVQELRPDMSDGAASLILSQAARDGLLVRRRRGVYELLVAEAA